MDKMDLLQDLDRWQASSHPSLANRYPKELFEPSFVERYHRLHNDLWWRLIRVHGTISTLERLRSFPLDLLYAPGEMEFWRLVIVNFFDVAVLSLHALVNDTGEDTHTLRAFRADIMGAPWLREEDRDLLRKTLRERRFDAAVKSIAERVDKLRDSYVAHRLVDRQTGRFDESLPGVSLDELRRLFDATQLLFGALCFGATYLTLVGDLTPTTIGGRPQPTCLDTVLDAVLRDSFFVNMPERRAEWWPMHRSHMCPEELRRMNELRRHVGLPEA